jgi:hypothetical protein
MARGRFREALDVLNEAIRMDPRYAESFENRATVFERLGMYPQAEADRRKVAALGGVQRPPPPPPPEPRRERSRGRRVPPPAPVAVPPEPTLSEDEPALEADVVDAPHPEETRPSGPPRYPAPQRSSNAGAIFRSLATVLVSVGLLVAAGVGIYLALDTISEALEDDGEAVVNPGDETPVPSDGASPLPTLPPDTPEEALEGDPLSFTRFASAWQSAGITASPGNLSTAVTGFSRPAVDVTLSRNGESMVIAMLLYDGAGAPGSEWNLGAEAITPKTGTIPACERCIWYNLNAVVIVTEPNEALRQEALDAFLDVSS